MQIAYFAGGCFWCVEAIFQRIDGVNELTNGLSATGRHKIQPMKKYVVAKVVTLKF